MNTKSLLLSLLSLLSLLPMAAKDNDPVKREMRGAWVATIYGLDWPSTKGTDADAADAQRREMTDLLDRLQRAGFNAVMFQARTFSDAMYPSSLEPWASALTGRRGSAPVDGWDPLAFCINESHSRGMECHVWINPFRYSNSATPYADKHDKKLRPMLLSFAPKPKNKREKPKATVILDPGNPQARQHVVDVCRDIVTRYDIDGLVFDDYFYPDRLPLGGGYDYDEWKASKTPLSQADWRRHNVNTTVAAVSKMIKSEKPWVTFGISPAGVGGGNGVSASRHGLPPCKGNDWMYDRIFCDPLAWMAAGDVDYIAPQIYWERDHKTNPYQALATWWGNAARALGCAFYPAISLSSMANPGGDTSEAWKERQAQVEINRSVAPGDGGTIHYAARNINGFGQHLAKSVYSTPALPPSRPNAQATDPGSVTDLRRRGNTISWTPVKSSCRYAVYAMPRDVDHLEAMSVNHGGYSARYLLGMTYTNHYTLPASVDKDAIIAVSPVDRWGNEWEPTLTK